MRIKPTVLVVAVCACAVPACRQHCACRPLDGTLWSRMQMTVKEWSQRAPPSLIHAHVLAKANRQSYLSPQVHGRWRSVLSETVQQSHNRGMNEAVLRKPICRMDLLRSGDLADRGRGGQEAGHRQRGRGRHQTQREAATRRVCSSA